MNENELFVDNPLALAGLFEGGIYLASNLKPLTEAVSVEKTEILVLLHYPELIQLPPKAFQLLNKIMSAVKWNGKMVDTSNYLVMNSGKLEVDIDETILNSAASKILLWSDVWPMSQKEIPFYKTKSEENVDILRCHSLHTVMADPERKKACWGAIRVFFGM